MTQRCIFSFATNVKESMFYKFFNRYSLALLLVWLIGSALHLCADLADALHNVLLRYRRILAVKRFQVSEGVGDSESLIF